LVRPVPKTRVVYTDNELLVPKGGKLIFRQEMKAGGRVGASDLNRQAQYIRYILPEKKRTPPGTPMIA